MEKYMNSKVTTMGEVIKEFHVSVGEIKLSFKILKDSTGFYYHSTSHFYQSAEQADPYISSINVFDTLEEAIYGAINQLTYFYNESHEFPEDNWIKNSLYV